MLSQARPRLGGEGVSRRQAWVARIHRVSARQALRTLSQE
jgi:hypothetical protein